MRHGDRKVDPGPVQFKTLYGIKRYELTISKQGYHLRGGGPWGWLTLQTKQLRHPVGKNQGTAGQVIAAKWVILTVLERERLTFGG